LRRWTGGEGRLRSEERRRLVVVDVIAKIGFLTSWMLMMKDENAATRPKKCIFIGSKLGADK
jgi:hypothetical protein